MSNKLFIILVAWLLEALGTQSILDWHERLSGHAKKVKPISVVAFAPIVFPILLYFYLKYQLLCIGLWFYTKFSDKKKQ